MTKQLFVGVAVFTAFLFVFVAPGISHEEHHGAVGEIAAHSEKGEMTLTGEVVDVVCYLSHDAQGLGKGHTDCAKKCITGGLPVALKVGDQLYLASMGDHTAANAKLAPFAGRQVTVHGKVLERDGQRLILVSEVEKAE